MKRAIFTIFIGISCMFAKDAAYKIKSDVFLKDLNNRIIKKAPSASYSTSREEITLWEDDFETIQNYYTDYVREVVTRYSNDVDIWNSIANVNVDNCLSLSEEQLLHMAVSTIETIRKHDTRTPLIFTVSQPWGEYLSRSTRDMSPMTFADTLVRSDLGINGIGLEINWGFHDESTLPRDLLELSQHIDRWSHLGLPLVVHLTIADLIHERRNQSGTDSLTALRLPDDDHIEQRDIRAIVATEGGPDHNPVAQGYPALREHHQHPPIFQTMRPVLSLRKYRRLIEMMLG